MAMSFTMLCLISCYNKVQWPPKIVSLTPVISTDELIDDDDYQDILEDMREESRKFGKTLI
ncbi:splicing factor u2af large subunit b [Quercus suber]|uniref:Splicing factor u2af large subunit b n=1 Tax=Quercus suber TaxID=58331 RepID=A0AAW0KX97_QUESU